MPITFGVSPLLLIVCVLGAAGLTWWTYRRTTPSVSATLRWTLGGLRFAAFALILFLLFEPVHRRIFERQEAPRLAVVIDESSSIPFLSDAPDTSLAARLDLLRRRIAPAAGLAPEGETVVYAFGDGVRRLAALPAAWPDSLGFTGARTDIARALEYVLEDQDEGNLGAVLLLSDGRYNTGRNPVYVADRYKAPIFSIVLGDTTESRDVQVESVVANEIAVTGVEQPVRVYLRAEALGGAPVQVQLLQAGRVLAAERLTLPEGSGGAAVNLRYTPQQEGLAQYTVAVSRLAGEATYRNNQETFSVDVLRRKKRVLVVAAAPDPDVAAIRQILTASSDTEIQTFTQKAPGEFYEGSFPASLTGVEAIVLAGYPGKEADPALAARLAEAARRGAPLFFLLSTRTDLEMLGRFFGDVLPAAPEVARPGFVEVSFDPSASAASHPILAVSGDQPDAWKRLPPLLYNESRWRTAPDARVLATAELRGVRLADPLLVVRTRGAVRSAALLGAGAYRWRNLPQDLAAYSNFWPDLLSSAVRWVATPEDNKPVRVRPIRPAFQGGEAVRFTGQVFDESMNPVENASVGVEVAGPAGRRFTFVMDPLGAGRYALDAGALPEGSYRYLARALASGDTLGTAGGVFSVGALTLEYKDTRADAALMRALALRSGGRMLSLDSLDRLPELLAAAPAFAPRNIEVEQEVDYRRMYGFLPLIIGLLTLEWFFRKRSGMI